MSATALMFAIGSIGLFSARAFLPAFLVSLLLRFGPGIPAIASWRLFSASDGVPSWFTHDATLIALGILAVAEIAATKIPELERALHAFEPYVKTSMAVLTSAGVLETGDAAFVDQALAAGVGSVAVALPAGAGTFAVSSARIGVLRALAAIDEDDVLRVRRLWSWMEDFGVLAGALLLLALPLLVMLLVLLGILVLFLARMALRRWDEARKVPCATCKTPLYRGALECPQCRTATAVPMGVSLRARTVVDRSSHRLDLLERRRCPRCASHHRGALAEPCSGCEIEPFFAADTERYLARIDERVVPVLLACFVFGLVPFFGGALGILLYRARLIAPLRIWVPARRSILLRITLSAAQFCLLALHWIPLLGALSIPAMAWLAFRFYRPACAAALLPEPDAPPRIAFG